MKTLWLAVLSERIPAADGGVANGTADRAATAREEGKYSKKCRECKRGEFEKGKTRKEVTLVVVEDKK